MQSWNYIRLFEGNREADVAPSENEFDTPELEQNLRTKNRILWNFIFI